MTNPEIQAVLAGESDGCVVCGDSQLILPPTPAGRCSSSPVRRRG